MPASFTDYSPCRLRKSNRETCQHFVAHCCSGGNAPDPVIARFRVRCSLFLQNFFLQIKNAVMFEFLP